MDFVEEKVQKQMKDQENLIMVHIVHYLAQENMIRPEEQIRLLDLLELEL